MIAGQARVQRIMCRVRGNMRSLFKVMVLITVLTFIFIGVDTVYTNAAVINVSSGTIFNATGTDTSYIMGDDFTFSSITLNEDYIMFNGAKVQVYTSPNTDHTNVTAYTFSTGFGLNKALTNFTVDVDAHSASILVYLYGYQAGEVYSLYVDDNFYNEYTASAAGHIFFKYTNIFDSPHDFLLTGFNITGNTSISVSQDVFYFHNHTYGDTDYVANIIPMNITNTGTVTIDGTNNWIQLYMPFLYDDASGEVLGLPVDWMISARINMGTYHTYLGFIDYYDVLTWDVPGGWVVNISDDLWDYTFNPGDTMTLYWQLKIHDDSPIGSYDTLPWPGHTYNNNWSNQCLIGDARPCGVAVANNYYPQWGGLPEIPYYEDIWDVMNDTDYGYTFIDMRVNITSEVNPVCPVKPYSPVPLNNSAAIHPFNPIMGCTVGDVNYDLLTVRFYWANHTLFYTTEVDLLGLGLSTHDIIFPLSEHLDYDTTYSWYVNVTDGNCTNTSDTWIFHTLPQGQSDAPMLFDPNPADEAVNVSIMPLLSIKVYDPNGDNMTVSIYDGNGDLLQVTDYVYGAAYEGDTTATRTAYATYTGTNNADTVYQWYAVAEDENGNVAQYPIGGGYLSFKTVNRQPPMITFITTNVNGDYIAGVNISCVENNRSVTTDGNGYASMAFNWDEYNQVYHFNFNKTGYVLKRYTYAVVSDTHVITMERRGSAPGGGGGINDVGDLFMDQMGSFGAIGQTIIALLICIGAAIWMDHRDTHIIFTLTVFFSLFGMFIAFGLLPIWLVVIPGAVVAVMLANNLWGVLFGKRGEDTV